MRIFETCSPDLQYSHHSSWHSSPHFPQMLAKKGSLDSSSRSISSIDVPCATRQSRSISPTRSPPSRERPCVGWCVSAMRGPFARAKTLSLTMCFSRW